MGASIGKRSDFPRIDKDHYPTIDPRAVLPLLPHLAPGIRYAEPCAGEGHLVDQLEGHGVRLAWASCIIEPKHPRIIPGVDVLTIDSAEDADLFITNPPWKRPLLHKVIVHLSNIAPTWLLFDSNWANTKQAARFMTRCRKIVAVGRLIWIPGTTTSGKDDCSWYLFDRPMVGSAPVFFGRGCLPPDADRPAHRICPDCGVPIDRAGRWSLKMRNGVPAPVHDDCAHPSGAPAMIDTSLLEWGGLTDA